MKGEITAKIIKNLKQKVVYWRFLLVYKIDKNELLKSLSSKEFYYEVLKSVENQDYSCKSVCKIFNIVSTMLFDYSLEDRFISDAYNYVLKKSFPESVIDFSTEVQDKVFELYLIMLRVFNEYQKYSEDQTFMSVYPFEYLNEKERLELDNSKEYSTFVNAFEDQYIYELMKLNNEVSGHSSIEHILGVHYYALYIARQIKNKRVPIDLGRVSAAAAGHDIGKFGCKPEESNMIAYYHYYYTNEWFEKLDLKYSRNVAVNHSTWDLELESLSLESLVLIFSDFCVKGSKDKEGIFKMKFLNVDESFEIILSKLDNVDINKVKRYELVCQKLKNFSEYLEKLGVDLLIENYTGKNIVVSEVEEVALDEFIEPESVNIEYNKFYSLNNGNNIVENLKFLAIDKSVRLMHQLRDETSLNNIIQKALNEKDIQLFRRYIFIFEEYSTYLTPDQKIITIDFLNDYLVHPKEDIRKSCSHLIGKLIAFYDENYTKELPKSANVVYKLETKVKIVLDLFDDLITNKVRMTNAKRERQANSNFEVLVSLFHYGDNLIKEKVIEIVVSFLEDPDLDRYSILFLLDVFGIIPTDLISDDSLYKISRFIFKNSESEEEEIRITSMSKLNILFTRGLRNRIIGFAKKENYEDVFMKYVLNYKDFSLAEKYFCNNLTDKNSDDYFKIDVDLSNLKNISFSNLYLSNLKTATPKVIKKIQIELLYNRSLESNVEERFYTAMHFCNILKVSAYETVRNTAGSYLLKLFDLLSTEQKNDIIIELIRALEIEGYGFTSYIPNFLGQLIPRINSVEYHEIIEDISFKISNAGIHVRVLLLKTIGTMIKEILLRGSSLESELERLVGFLFRGYFSGHNLTSQIAFNVMSKELIGDNELTIDNKFEIFKLLYKKINIYIMDIRVLTEFDLLNYSVGLNYIYKFITDYIYLKKEMVFEKKDKVAFYNGTFDPFSLGQKKAAVDAKNLGMEVYIAISEFQWQRRTQPSLLRRQIVEMSIADALDIYAFPPEIPINLWNKEDLRLLKNVFKNKEVYLIVGEDTLLYDSLYLDVNSPIYEFPHIVYMRKSINYIESERAVINKRISNILGEVIIRDLEYKYEMIDVELIRRNIDKNSDGFDLIDDLATKFILDHNLYKNEPEYKSIVSTTNLIVKVEPLKSCENIEKYCEKFGLDFEKVMQLTKMKKSISCNEDFVLDRTILSIIDEEINEVIAISIYAKAEPKHLFDEVKNLEILDEIAEKKYKKILIFDHLCMLPYDKVHALDQIILTESIMKEIPNGYEYAVVKDFADSSTSSSIYGVLIRSGFIERQCSYSKKRLFCVAMTSPVVLNLDGTTRMKYAFRQNMNIRDTIKLVRTNLQQALVELYPGRLVLSFDRSMLYNHLIRLISDANKVSTKDKKEYGDCICVPYGDIFKRWILPNTITKAFHTERYYTPGKKTYEVGAYPGYLSIKNQTNILKSFGKPVILVDDLFDKGNRLNALAKYFDEYDISVKKVIVGILSKRGLNQLEEKNISTSAAYYIPNICVWFNESDLYPFIGGDSLYRENRESKSVLYSTNLMLPFAYPDYIKDVSKKALYKLSEVCLSNAYVILSEIEKLYLDTYRRNLTIRNIREVMITPRVPDIGSHVCYDLNYKPTDYIKNEMESLEKIRPVFD